MVAFFLLAASACVKSVELPAPDSGVAGPGSGPCSLLSPEELEVALNVAVSAVQEHGRPVLPGMKMCAAGSGPSAAFWGVADRGVGPRWRDYQALNQKYLTRVSIRRNTGLWDGRLGTVVVRRQDLAVGVRLSIASPPLERGQTRDEYLEATAARLAGEVLERLE